MFTAHFQMKGQPFTERTPVERILQDERIKQGLARLKYLMKAGTIAMISGGTGVGKSSLIKLFLHSLGQNRCQPVYLHITDVRATSLLKLIVAGMGESPKNTKDRLFSQIFDKSQKSEATTLLIIDEAHLLTSEALTDLRLLVSSALDETPPLKILLSGQEALVKNLRKSCHLDLAHRISVRYHLHSLSPAGTSAYIDHQMTSAGSNDKVFDPAVKTSIHEYSNGVPRQINNIATACLIQGSAGNAKKITREIFVQAVGECQF